MPMHAVRNIDEYSAQSGGATLMARVATLDWPTDLFTDADLADSSYDHTQIDDELSFAGVMAKYRQTGPAQLCLGGPGGGRQSANRQ